MAVSSTQGALTVSIDQAQLDEVYRMLDGLLGTATSEKGADAALRRSLNKTIDHAQSSAVKRVASEINLLQKEIRAYTSTVKANFSELSGKVIISRHAIPLADFPYTVTSRLSGVFVSIRKNGLQEFFTHRFIATMPSGHVGIFERGLPGDERSSVRRKSVPRRESRSNLWGSTVLPIDKAFGPSPGMVFYENGDPDMEEIADFFARTLDHEVEFILSQA